MCAGPNASGRLRLAFAAMVEQLVRQLQLEPVGGMRQLLSLRCLLHMELRADDMPMLHAVGLLPVLHKTLLLVLHKTRRGDRLAFVLRPTP